MSVWHGVAVTATVPYWLDEPYTPRPALERDVEVDVCVVGGGVGGLAATWRLLDDGRRPLVLEAREIAAAASGRNGGFFIAGAAPMYHHGRERWGRERAAAIQRATLEAQAEMLAVAEEVGALEHFRLDGMLRLAVDAEEAADVRAHHAALAEDGFAGELVPADELPAALRRPERVGLFSPGDGTVHPVRWLRALASAAEARGATIAEGTRVLGPPEPDGDGVLVRTERATVRAGRVVVAMDGGLAALVPAAAAVRPRRLNMLATAPEKERRLPCALYARYGHEYAQQRPDGCVTLGGFSDLDGAASWTDAEDVSQPVQERLDAYLRDELGVRAPVTHRWVGVVGYAEDPLPMCGPVPGTDDRVLAFGGYNGTGHVQAWVASRAVVDALGGRPAHGLYATFT